MAMSPKSKRKLQRKLITPRDAVTELVRGWNRQERLAEEFMKTDFVKNLLQNWGKK